MSTPEGKRNTSEMQFMIGALDLQSEILDLLARDFGVKDKVRSIEQFARMLKMQEDDQTEFLEIVKKYHMPDNDAETVMEMVDKYHMKKEDRGRFAELVKTYNMNDLVISEFPQWLIDYERRRLMQITDEIIDCLSDANEIYPIRLREYDERRVLQDYAITGCFRLLNEMQKIIRLFPVNKQKYMRYTEMIWKEIELIRAWRKSDNKILRRIEREERKQQKEESEKDKSVELLSRILEALNSGRKEKAEE